jgi:hypothetical protein
LAFVRIGFNYFIRETVFDHIVEAVHLIANHGWQPPPRYKFDPVSGCACSGPAPPRSGLIT